MGSLKERVEAAGIMAVVLEQAVESAMELGDVVGDEIGKVAVLGLTPNVFDGVEIWGVARKPRHFQPRATVQTTDSRAVRGQAIADQQQRAAQVVMHLAEE